MSELLTRGGEDTSKPEQNTDRLIIVDSDERRRYVKIPMIMNCNILIVSSCRQTHQASWDTLTEPDDPLVLWPWEYSSHGRCIPIPLLKLLMTALRKRNRNWPCRQGISDGFSCSERCVGPAWLSYVPPGRKVVGSKINGCSKRKLEQMVKLNTSFKAHLVALGFTQKVWWWLRRDLLPRCVTRIVTYNAHTSSAARSWATPGWRYYWFPQLHVHLKRRYIFMR